MVESLLVQLDLVPVARELGIGFLAYSPLGRGMLTGTIKSPSDVNEHLRKTQPRFHDGNFEKVWPLQAFSDFALMRPD